MDEIVPQDSEEVKPDELPEYGCNCVLPGQSCPDCEAAARAAYDGDELPY